MKSSCKILRHDPFFMFSQLCFKVFFRCIRKRQYRLKIIPVLYIFHWTFSNKFNYNTEVQSPKNEENLGKKDKRLLVFFQFRTRVIHFVDRIGKIKTSLKFLTVFFMYYRFFSFRIVYNWNLNLPNTFKTAILQTFQKNCIIIL